MVSIEKPYNDSDNFLEIATFDEKISAISPLFSAPKFNANRRQISFPAVIHNCKNHHDHSKAVTKFKLKQQIILLKLQKSAYSLCF